MMTEKKLTMRKTLIAGVVLFALPTAVFAQEKASSESANAQGEVTQSAAMVPPAPQGPYFSRRLMPQGSMQQTNANPMMGAFPPPGFDPMVRSDMTQQPAGASANGQSSATSNAQSQSQQMPQQMPQQMMRPQMMPPQMMRPNMRPQGPMMPRQAWQGQQGPAQGFNHGPNMMRPQPQPQPQAMQPQQPPRQPWASMRPQPNAQPQPQQPQPQASAQNRFQPPAPPAEPDWVKERRREAERRRDEAQKRFAQSRNQAPFGPHGQPGPQGQPNVGAPFAGPYGYGPQPRFPGQAR